MLEIEPVGASSAYELLARQLLGDTSSDQQAFHCAVLRSCVWALSRGREPVHTTRVLSIAVDALPSIDAHQVPEARARLRETLDVLTDVGDLIDLPAGRWLPAPTRQVVLETDTDDRLIVGGLPSNLLPSSLRGLIAHSGPFRATRGDALSVQLGLETESLANWLGDDGADLEGWGERVMAIELEPYAEPFDGARFRIYAPSIARKGEPQHFRWVERDRLRDATGRFLARRDLGFGIHQPRIVALTKGRITATASPVLAQGDMRRLMYSLDALARNPTSVRITTDERTLTAVLRSELPRSEQRFFGALGKLTAPRDDYYPRTWSFPSTVAQRVRARFLSLRVHIIDTGNEANRA